MQITSFNKPPKPTKQWQSGLFWIGFFFDNKSEFSKAIVSWPWKCESVAIPLPDNVKTQEDALNYLREQLIEGLKESNGVNG